MVAGGTWYRLVSMWGGWLFLVHEVVVVVGSLWLPVGGGCWLVGGLVSGGW